jgi:hypothetical protein
VQRNPARNDQKTPTHASLDESTSMPSLLQLRESRTRITLWRMKRLDWIVAHSPCSCGCHSEVARSESLACPESDRPKWGLRNRDVGDNHSLRARSQNRMRPPMWQVAPLCWGWLCAGAVPFDCRPPKVALAGDGAVVACDEHVCEVVQANDGLVSGVALVSAAWARRARARLPATRAYLWVQSE